MTFWKAHLREDPTEWLMEEDRDNPSIRYFTLKDLLGKREGDPEMGDAREKIMKEGPVPRILSRQLEAGNWGIPEDFYIRSKYRGTAWTLIVLAELGADGHDDRVRKACEFVLEHSQDRYSGAFCYLCSPGGGGRHECAIPCLTGNMVFSLLRLGYKDDPMIQNAIGWITRYQRFDDGIPEAPRGWPYEKFPKCWGRHTCHMGVVKALKALAEIPPERRSQEVKVAIEKGAEHMLKHRICMRSHEPKLVSIPRWLQFGFPRMAETDALEVLGVLLRLGYRDERMRNAVSLVESKQDALGKWSQESRFSSRFLVSLERRGAPSKWVTLKALSALKNYYGVPPPLS